MTHKANTPEREEAICKLASKFSEVASGQPLDILVAAAALLIVAQADHANSTAYNDYIAKKLKQVVALYETPAGPF